MWLSIFCFGKNGYHCLVFSSYFMFFLDIKLLLVIFCYPLDNSSHKRGKMNHQPFLILQSSSIYHKEVRTLTVCLPVGQKRLHKFVFMHLVMLYIDVTVVWLCNCWFILQLGPKAEDVKKPVNPFSFLIRFILGTIVATYYVLVPFYMWIKDQIVPKGQPI